MARPKAAAPNLINRASAVLKKPRKAIGEAIDTITEFVTQHDSDGEATQPNRSTSKKSAAKKSTAKKSTAKATAKKATAKRAAVKKSGAKSTAKKKTAKK